MPWFRLDDKSWGHAKVVAAGNAAWGALCRLGAWSSDHGTDGSIPMSVACLIASQDEIDRLVAVGLLERETDVCLRIHDFLDRNPSARDTERTRKKRADAGRIGGLRSASIRQASEPASAQAPASPGASHALKQKGNPDPVPSPNPDPKKKIREFCAQRLPDDWQPSADQLAALRLKHMADPLPALERFKNHFLGMDPKSRNAKKLRWDLAFANWVAEDAARKRLPPWQPPAAPPAPRAPEDPAALEAAKRAALGALDGVKRARAPFLFPDQPSAPAQPPAAQAIAAGVGGQPGPNEAGASSGQKDG